VDASQYYRIGDVTPVAADVRVVAASNRHLPTEVKAGRFRKDLYFRLSAAHLVVPPLRDRPREIPLLARAFLDQARARLRQPTLELSGSLLQTLAEHPFTGNVRELANAMEYAAAVADGPAAEPNHLPPAFAAAAAAAFDAPPTGEPALPPTFRPIAEELAELEKRRMREALLAAGGNQSRAADLIAMPRRTFVTKLARYGLSRRR
jgi:DNA-binding NtrC family response regulator